MENKIEVIIDILDGVNQLIFKLTDSEINLNLEDDNSEEIKKVFLGIIQELEKKSFQLELKQGDSFDDANNKLFLDASKEYIEQLNEEIKEIEKDPILKEIRAART